MDPNLSLSPDIADARPSFRKPSNDAANRKYRRRSPVSVSAASSEGSPNHDRSPSPEFHRDNPAKISDDPRRRENGGRELEMESGHSRSGRCGDSYRNSERQPYRSSHDYHMHDDHSRYRRHADGGERRYQRSSWSGRDSRSGTRSDCMRQESEYERRDYQQHVDKYTRDKPDCDGHGRRRLINSNLDEVKIGEERHNSDREGRDDKKDCRKSLGDYKNDHISSFDESRGHGKDSTAARENGRNGLTETRKSSSKELDGQKRNVMERRKHEDNEFLVKKPKLCNADEGTGGKIISKFTCAADETPSSSKQVQEIVDKVIPEPAQSSANEAVSARDLNAAKLAAMKAAELVNRNLIGGGYMSTDQKKKILWGNKKTSAAEESVHHWDMPLFSDQERQEKFNKLMGVKSELKLEHKTNDQGGSGLLLAEKQKEVQLDLEKQYTAGLRRRDGRTVGLGL